MREGKKVWVCTECGSPDVFSDAYVNMNDDTDIRTYDATFCDFCEGECSVEEIDEADVIDPAEADVSSPQT